MALFSRNICAVAAIILSGSLLTEARGGPPKVIVVPHRLEADTLSTLKPIAKSTDWATVKPALQKLGYDVFHDRVDKKNEFTVSVGWDKDHLTFRSYKIYVKDGRIKCIKADYAYPGL